MRANAAVEGDDVTERAMPCFASATLGGADNRKISGSQI